jgi:hypothetical protein
MDEQYIIDLYNQLGGESRFGKFENFKKFISTDSSYQQDFYDEIGQSTLGSFDNFKSLVSASQQPTQQPMAQEQQPVKKKEDWESSWFGEDGTSESEPSKTKDGLRDAFRSYSNKLLKPEAEPKVITKEEEPYNPNASVEEYTKSQSPVVYEEPKAPLAYREGSYPDLKNRIAAIDSKMQAASTYDKPKLFLEKADLQSKIKEIESSPVREYAEDDFLFGKPVDITAPKFIEENLNALTARDLSQFGTDGAKKTLDYYFQDAGFKVEKGYGNSLEITSPTGETHTLNTIYPSTKSLNDLKDFIRINTYNNPEIAKKEYLYEKENKKFRTKEEVDSERKSLNDQEHKYNDEYKQYLNMQKDIEDIKKDLKRWEDFNEQNTPKYIQTSAYLKEKEQELGQYKSSLINKESELRDQAVQINKAVGKYTELKASQGSIMGAAYRSFADATASLVASYTRYASNAYIELAPLSELTNTDEFNSRVQQRLKEKGIPFELDKPLDNRVYGVEKEIEAEIRDEWKKAAISGQVGDVKLQNVLTIEGVEKNISNALNSIVSTTDEYNKKMQAEGNILQRSFLGLAGSAPAMIGPSLIRYANMFNLTSYSILKEMDQDPDFKNISENERQMVAASIGVVGAALEEIGFRKLIKGTPVASTLLRNVFGRIPPGATASQIRRTTLEVATEMGIRGGTPIVAGMLIEAETGLAQKVSEYYIKDIYNGMNEKKMFDNPEFSISLDSQYMKDVIDATLTESFGGGMMRVPYAVGAAFQKDGFVNLDDATFKIFEELAKDSDSRKFFVTSLKNKINSGEVTAKQANELLNAYDQSSGMIAQVPDEIIDVNDRKAAMELMNERKRLENKIEGKDPALSKPIQAKIDNINEQLNTLTEDAIQKQAASEVSLQPETEPSKEMEAGGAEAGPQAAPQQGVLSPEETQRKEELANKKNELEQKLNELQQRQKQELEALNKKENKSYADPYDILNVNEFSEDQSQRSQEAIDLANRQNKEFQDLIQERNKLQSESSKTNYSSYDFSNNQQELDNLRNSITDVYQNDRQALDEGFAIAPAALDEAVQVGGDQYVAHGMAKTSLAKAFSDLINLFSKGIDPNMGRGSLDVATLAGGAAIGTTSSGNAYMDGPFTLVANRDHQGAITDINQVGGIIVNEGMATPEVLDSLRKLFPNLIIESTSNTKLLVEQLNNKKSEQQATTEGLGTQAETATKEQETFEQKKSEIEKIVDPEQRKVAEIEFIMSNLMSGVGEAAANKIREYADRIISGKETRDQVIQGLPKSFVNGIDQLLAAQQSPTTEQQAAPVQPAEQQFTEQDRARKQELTDALAKADKRRKNVTVGETVMPKADVKAELDALNQKELSSQQPVSEVALVAPTETAPTETLTPEQEADKLEQMMLAKMGAPKVEAAPVTEAPVTETPTDQAPVTETLEPTTLTGVSYSDIVVGDKYLEDILSDNNLSEDEKQQVREIFRRGIYYFKFDKNSEQKFQEKFANPEDITDIVDVLTTISAAQESAFDFYNTNNYENVIDYINYIINNQNDYSIKVVNAVKEIKGKLDNPISSTNRLYAIDIMKELGIKSESTTKEKPSTKTLSDAVRSLKIKGPGGLQSNILGVPIAIWNAAMDTVAKAIDAGIALSGAVQKGYDYIKDKHKAINKERYEKKLLSSMYSDVIKTARANGISEDGIKTFLKRKGLDDAKVETLLKEEKGAGKKITVSEKTLPGYDKLINRITGVIDRSRKRGLTDEKIMENVINNVEANSPEYANATDQQREQIIRDIRAMFGKKEKKAPTAEKIVGKPKPKKVTVNDMTALKDQIRLEARAAREAKGDLNTKRKMLTAAIKDMVKKGKITTRQAKALINRVNSVNLDNPVMVERLLTYAEKVFNDAEYADKLNKANDLQSKIKQLSRNKEKFGNLTPFAAEFAKIDPAMVENIDEYIEMASNVKEGVQGSKIVKGNVVPADMVDVGKTMEYVNKMMEAQAETIRQKTAERLQELMGVDASDLTYDQMMELLNQPEDAKKDKYKEGIIRGFINKMFNTYSTIINDMFETGIDPFSDPDNPTTVDFKESDKKIVEEFMDMDLSLLDAKEALRAADALNNFIVNKSTAGMVATLGDYNGRKNIREVVAQGKKAKQIKMYWSPILGKTYFQQIASIPAFFERLFKSYDTGRYIREMMGINSLVNHKADAVTAANKIINNYILEFSKKRPNNKNFQDISNIIERNIIGDLAKTIVGDAKQVEAEFNRRKKLIEQSIKILEEAGTKKETQMAKSIKEVYDKIAKDSKTIEEVKAKADQINVDAVQFWVDTWAKLFDQFADVALNVYNRVLDKNVNYVPDRFGFIEIAEKKQKDADGFESAFFANSNSEYFYKKEAGSLMKSTPPQSLLDEDGNSTGMYVNMSFDTNNANALMDALIDIKTAADIRQIQAFKNDPNFKNVFPFGKDAIAVKERIAAMIRNIRNKRAITDKSFKEMIRKMDRIAAIGTSLLLAGPTQAISQTIPVAVNTIINSGGKLNLSIINNKDANRFIDESGMGIANRGSDAVTELETLNQKLEVAAKTKAGATAQYIENLNREYLKLYLSNFDVLIARASWITYYEKGLRKHGIKGKVDYSNHKLNKDAAQYAQDMIDRQQNISDKDLAGQFYNSDNPLKQIIIKVIMPLTTFRMNQTTRFSNDLAILISKTASTEERLEAAVSVGGFAAEMATFRAIKLYMGYYVFYSLAQFIRGEEDDEEEKKKTWDNMKKGAATSVVSDVFSPIPQTDVPVKNLFSAVLDQLQNIASIEEDDKFNIFTENKASLSSDFGLLGVSIDKIMKLGERIELARTGKFKDEFGNEKTISESDRALLSDPFYIGINVATAFGLNPFAPETDNVMNRITKMAKKNAMSNNQLKEAEELGVGNKKDLLKAKAEKKADKAEAYGGYETLKEFEEKDPEKFDEYSAPGGKLYKYKESEKLEEKEKNKDKPLTENQIEKLKKESPREWRENYGPGTEYFREQNTPEKRRERAMEKREEAKRDVQRKRREQQEKIRKAQEERAERYGR